MLFGSKKQNALSDGIVEAIRPVLGRVATKHGLPSKFWDDPYALGFMMGQINGWIAARGGPGVGVAEKGRIIVECLGELSEMKGKPISEKSMVFANMKDEDFLVANQNGMFIAMYIAGTLPDADRQPAILAAQSELAEAGREATPDAVVGHLIEMHWIEEIRERFSVG